jgi:hypothetical protein
LVARTLEQRWEEALRQQARLQEEYDRRRRDTPPQVSAADRARVQSLAEDIPALWQAPATTAADRKEIVRCLVERVVVQGRPDSEHVAVAIHWQGGAVSEYQVVRPVRRYAQLADLEGLLDRMVALRRQGQTAAAIAAQLNAEGYRMPKRRGRFTGAAVRVLLSRRGLAQAKTIAEPLAPGEWWLGDLARELQLPTLKLRDWVLRGWLHGRQTPAQGLWIVWADRDEVKRLRKLQAHSQRGQKGYPTAWTTPKKRPSPKV